MSVETNPHNYTNMNNTFSQFLPARISPKENSGASGGFLPKPLLLRLRHPNSKTNEPKFWQNFVRSQKLERLLTGYLDQVIDEQDYRLQKSKLLSEKKSLEEEISTFSHTQNDWLAPFQNWLKDAQSLDKIASDSDLFAKKVCAKEIFGSHLFLGEKTLRPAEGGNPNSFGKMGGNQWDALRASHLLALKKPLSSVLVPRGRLELPPLTGTDFESIAATITPPRQVMVVYLIFT